MNLDLKCLEWINTNQSARMVKTAKKSKQKNKHELSNTVYLLQIAPSRCSQSKLACLMSNQHINIVDQNCLKSIFNFKALDEASKTITEIGFYSKNDSLIFGSSDNGSLKCWDLRQDQSSGKFDECICFRTDEEREFLSVDLNVSDKYFIVGTNKNIDNSLVYIYDIRMNGKYLHKLTESHSNDVTQVKFDPNCESKFCSGSLDGLVCLYDLEQQPENIVKISVDKQDDDDSSDSDEDPDFMEQVLNTDSPIQKIGYLSSKCSEIDQIYAITYTNDFFVWDLQNHDVVFQSKNSNLCNLVESSSKEEDEEYYFDCFYLRPGLMTICKGDRNGSFKLLNGNDVMFESFTANNTKDSQKKMHRDVIRSSYWNGQNLYTAGEDGFLFKWRLVDKNSQIPDSDEDKNDSLKSKKRDLNDERESDEDEPEIRIMKHNKDRNKKFLKRNNK